MAGLSDEWERKLLDCVWNQTNITAPTAIHLSLHSADPGETGANELSGGNYARANCTTSFPAASGGGGTLANNVQINFPTANADWTTATHWGLWDASTAGVFIWSGSLTSPRTILNGVQAQVLVNDLVPSVS